jgi:hypothetical protein
VAAMLVALVLSTVGSHHPPLSQPVGLFDGGCRSAVARSWMRGGGPERWTAQATLRRVTWQW